MTLIISLLVGAFAGAIGGLCAGWLARGREEVIVEKIVERMPDDVVRKRDQANEILTQLQELTLGVSARIDAHTRTVGTINDELNAAAAGSADAVVIAIKQLVESNTAMQSQLHVAQERLEQQANLLEVQQEEARTDPLTKLRNRRALDDESARRVAEFSQKGVAMSLMMLDVDHFKKCNDTFGHLAGDEVLRMVGRVVAEHSLNHSGLYGARFGGEEFAVLFSGVDLEAAAELGDAIRRQIGETPVTFEGQSIVVSASAGVASLVASEGVAGLIARADEALYAAKRSGRNASCLHDGASIHKLASSERAAPPAYATEVDSADALHKAIARRIAEWRRGGVKLSLVVARIDNLATIESQQGCRGQGKAMTLAGDFFKRTLREMDQVALLKGEFFGMMLPNAKLSDAARIAERMRVALHNGDLDEGLGAHITMSFGVAEVSADDDGDSLLLRARRAMEAARRRGGNAVYVNDGVYSTLADDLVDVDAAKCAVATPA